MSSRRYQSITNWFQNQRSLAKKRKEEDAETAAHDSSGPNEASIADFSDDSPTFSAFPPTSNHHPTLTLHPASHLPHELQSRPTHSPIVSLTSADVTPRRPTPARKSTPYDSCRTSLARPRRTRPEPYQLHALRRLFEQTSIPTIEQRTNIASEINM
jgi:hypothetical protein